MSESVQAALRDLPVPAPPYSAWPRLQQALRRQQRQRQRQRIGVALAASLALALLVPHWRPGTPPARDPILAQLIDESAQLERWLAAQDSDAFASVDAAALRVDITDRLQWIDELLEQPVSTGAARQALWQERVWLLRQLTALNAPAASLAADTPGSDDALLSL